MKQKIVASLITAALALSGCNQQGNSNTTKTNTSGNNTSTPAGANASAESGFQLQSVSGQVATGALVKGARVAVYSFAGKLCGEATSSENGSYSIQITNCTGPLIVAAEPAQDYGKGLYGLITAEQAKANASVSMTLTPISTVIAMLVIGDHPQAVVYGKQLANSSRITSKNIAIATEKVKSIIAPLLQAAGATDATLIQDNLEVGKKFDLALDMLDVVLNVDPDIKDYSVSFWVPTLHRPLMLKNTYANLPDQAYIDPSNGIDPNSVDTNFLAKAQQGLVETKSFVSRLQTLLQTDGNTSELVDQCFMNDGGGKRIGEMMLEQMKGGTISNLRLLRYNIFTDFDDEDHEQTNQSTVGDVAQISFDLEKDGNKIKMYTWLVKGTYNSHNCTSSGAEWRWYGNQRLFRTTTNAYSLYRTEVSSGIATRKDTRNSGLEFFISDTPNSTISHVQVTGPGLPSEGTLLVKSQFGGFFSYPGSLIALRTIKDLNTLEDQLTKYASTALLDNNILGTGVSLLSISDNLEDRRNTYRFRAYTGLTNVAPTYIYKSVLRKRPLLSTEMPVTAFPIIGYDNEQLLQVLANSGATKLEWNLPDDIWKQNMRAQSTWLSRFGEEKNPVTNKITKYKEFSAPGSYQALNYKNTGYTQVAANTAARGTLKEGSLQFRALDSDNRSVIVEYTYNLAR